MKEMVDGGVGPGTSCENAVSFSSTPWPKQRST
jgi:hypothetical protein